MNQYRIKLPVRPYIKKFLGEEFRPKQNPMVWLMVRPYLIRKISDTHSQKQINEKLSKLKDSISIVIPVSKIRLYGTTIEPASIMAINKVLEYLFGKELYHYVKDCEKAPGRYKGYQAAVESFCAKFNIEIEQDISLEALMRTYQRHRVKT